MTHEERIQQATERGHQAGLNAKAAGYAADWSPLSGEWAGESIPELLGDLLPDGYQDEEIVSAYEEAALEAFTTDYRCRACRESNQQDCDHAEV